MDGSNFMGSFFCCLFPMVNKRRRTTRISAPLKRCHRVKTVFGMGMDRHRRILWLRTRAHYYDAKNAILEGISYDTSKILIVWCPQNVVSSDCIATMLHQYGEVEMCLDNYGRGSNPESKVWSGTVVQYSSLEEAREALKQIPRECEHIKILPMDFVLPLLIDCELLHGNFDQSSYSTVLISGRRSLEPAETFDLSLELSSYGEIDKLLFNYRLRRQGIFCRVSYPFLTQAYLAATLLEGSRCDKMLLSAEIEKNGRDERILEETKKSLMVMMETYVP